MQVAQANFVVDESVIRFPIIIPDIHSVRAFAQTLHNHGKVWEGVFEGWPASYTPEDATRRPANSKMHLVPAEFYVGESKIWHITISWEDGKDESPVELENRRGIDGESRLQYVDLDNRM